MKTARKVKIISNFYSLRDDQLSSKAELIIRRMTDNVHFPTPVPAIKDVSAAYADYVKALSDAKSEGKDKVVIKNQKRFSLEGLLNHLAMYVELNCQNDRAIADTSGFDLKKDSVPIGELEKPKNLFVGPGINRGTLEVSVDRVYGAHSYVFEHSRTPITPSTQWQTVVSTSSTCVITGLESGVEVAVRVAGVGANPMLVYTDVITRYVH